MSKNTFIHLRIHTEYSISHSINRIEDLLSQAKIKQIPALTITDTHNMFAAIRFYRLARKNGIKPIIGCLTRISQKSDSPRPNISFITLLCKNEVGYRNLCTLLTTSYLDSSVHAPAISLENLEKHHLEGLIVLSGGLSGGIAQTIKKKQLLSAQNQAEYWQNLCPNNFYIEIQRTQHPASEIIVEESYKIAQKLNLPLVATHPIQFMHPKDFRAHEARVCIAHGYLLDDPKRPSQFTQDQYFLSPLEMQEKFSDLPESILNTIEIAKRCNLEIQIGNSQLPDFPIPDQKTTEEYLKELAEKGLKEKCSIELSSPKSKKSYQERLAMEIDMISQTGFSGYFLIVADFINWAKKNDISVGPGRGSGAGSLVAYCLGITELDPLKYDLLFERFLNPDRVSMPDFDIDFCQDNRYRVIEYVKDKYGQHAVSQIITFGTMAARSSVRDVGRVLNLPYIFMDELAKLIPSDPNKSNSLKNARETEPILAKREENEEDVAECLKLAEQIEGITRNVGTHAGGILISPSALTNFCPLYKAQDSDDIVSQYDKDDIESIGLVKFDFLGLKTLTVIDNTIKSLKEKNIVININNISLEDKTTYQLLAQANTTALFQLESRGMRVLLKKLQPNCFEDIIAVLALYRPGPLASGMVEDFINRKQGIQKPEYFHPNLEAVLKPTYGIIVYQEQVMKISQIIGGYSLGGADLLRRAMGKKKIEEMSQQKSIFIQGAEEKGYQKSLAEKLFALMEKFAEYGFNKSHSAAYAILAYQTAWLKTHYKADFFASVLSNDMDNTDKIYLFYQDAIANDIIILPPDIRRSQYLFTVIDDKTILYGLGAIRGVGKQAALSIEKWQKKYSGEWDYNNFFQSIDANNIVGKRVIEALIRSGAFDSFHSNRSALMEVLPKFLKITNHTDNQQLGLFSSDTNKNESFTIPNLETWDEKKKLQEEKIALGFFLSSHPYFAYQMEMKYIISCNLNEIKKSPWNSYSIISGIIISVKKMMSRKGQIAFITIDDTTSTTEIVIFSETYQKYRHKLITDNLLIAKIRASQVDKTDSLRIISDQIYTLEEIRNRWAEKIIIKIQQENTIFEIVSVLESSIHDSGICVQIILHTNNLGCFSFELGALFQFDDISIRKIQKAVGNEHIQWIYENITWTSQKN